MPDAPAPAPPEPADPVLKKALAEAGLVKSQADARKAAADADTAEATARTAQLKSVVGEIPAAPYTGAVTALDGAALAEHNRLARRQLGIVASKVAGHVEAVAKGTHIFLTANEAGPAIAAAETYELQRKIVGRALDDAVALSKSIDPVGPDKDDGQDGVPIFAAAGLILSSLNAGLSYLRSDQALGGRTLTVDDQTLVTAVAEHLLKAHKIVWLDTPPRLSDDIVKELIDELAVLASQAADARLRAVRHASRIAALTPKPAPLAPPAPTGKAVGKGVTDIAGPVDPDPGFERPKHEGAMQALNSAVSIFEEFRTALLACADGVSGLQKVGRAKMVREFISGPESCVAIVTLEGGYGSTLSTKNALSTVFGGTPYKLSVQIQAAWRCFSGKATRLLGAGLEEAYQPFIKIDEVR